MFLRTAHNKKLASLRFNKKLHLAWHLIKQGKYEHWLRSNIDRSMYTSSFHRLRGAGPFYFQIKEKGWFFKKDEKNAQLHGQPRNAERWPSHTLSPSSKEFCIILNDFLWEQEVLWKYNQLIAFRSSMRENQSFRDQREKIEVHNATQNKSHYSKKEVRICRCLLIR